MLLTSATGDVAMVGSDHADARVVGVVSPSQRVVVSGSPSANGTLIEWRSTRTGEVTSSTEIAGAFRPVAIDTTDKVVALIDGDPNDHSRPSTAVVLADASQGERRRWTIAGAVVPEAFANFVTDIATGLPAGVFAIEYLDQSTYRVRVIDTTSGALGLPLNLRSKGETVDQVMTAVSRTAVFDPMNQLLFTLYQGQATENGEQEGAFIHTLGLVNGVWCLDVPTALGLADHPGALAVSPDGARLYAASSTGGVAAYVVADITESPDMPTARTVVDYGTSIPGVAVAAQSEADLGRGSDRVTIAASNREVVVARGSDIIFLDPVSLELRSHITWDMDVEAVTVLRDGTIVIAGTGRMTMISPDHQRLLDERTLPIEGEITRLAVVG
jgi:hypothetical protein